MNRVLNRISQTVVIPSLLVSLLLGTLPLYGQGPGELPGRIDLPDPEGPRQRLPGAVRSARTGPDGRVWLQVRPANPYPLETLKSTVERTYDHERPQVFGLEILGWGRGERIWLFRLSGNAGQGTLLGYDGSDWVQQKTYSHISFAHHPTVLDEYTLFPGKSGVAVFDGRTIEVLSKFYGKSHIARVAAEPGGRSAIIMQPYSHPLYRFQVDRLFPLPMDRDRELSVEDLAACRYGVFARAEETLLRLARASDVEGAGGKAVKDAVDRLVRKYLETGKQKVQKEIVRPLAGIKAHVLPYLRRNALQADSPTERWRIKQLRLLVQRNVRDERPGEAKDGQTSEKGTTHPRIGPYRISAISLLKQLETGHVLIGIRSGRHLKGERDLSPGLLIISPSGSLQYLKTPEAKKVGGAKHAQSVSQATSPRRVGANRYRLRSSDGTHFLLNTEDHSLTRVAAGYLMAIDRAGRRYVLEVNPEETDDSPYEIMNLRVGYKLHPFWDRPDNWFSPEQSGFLVIVDASQSSDRDNRK